MKDNNQDYLDYLRATGRIDDLMSHLYGLGWSVVDIAKEFHTSRQTVYTALDRHIDVLEQQAEQALLLAERKSGGKENVDELLAD